MSTNAPKAEKYCNACNKPHYDKNYTVCVRCGELL